MELWKREDFVLQVLRDTLAKDGAITPAMVRERAYSSSKEWKECTQFKPSLVVAVIQYFRATRVLDFSAGWGDRLTGAIAAGVERWVCHLFNRMYHAFTHVLPNSNSRFNGRTHMLLLPPPTTPAISPTTKRFFSIII